MRHAQPGERVGLNLPVAECAGELERALHIINRPFSAPKVVIRNADGRERENFACLLEQTWGGRDEVELEKGGRRMFLEDGDTVTLTGWGQLDGYRIGFGRCEGRILPAAARVGKGA